MDLEDELRDMARRSIIPEGETFDSMMDRHEKETAGTGWEIIGYTTAPEAYDGFGTVTFDPEAGFDDRGRPLRKVAIRPEHYDWQTMRYGSGLHSFATEAEAKKWPQLYRLKKTS